MLRQLRSFPDYELVSLPTIAARLRVSPAVINNITYEEGTTFPRPQDGRGKYRMWIWCEVLEWYEAHRILKGRSGSHIPLKTNRYRNQNRVYRRAS